MKKRLSGWEKTFLVVPLIALALAGQWREMRHAWYRSHPTTFLTGHGFYMDRTHFSRSGALIASATIDSADPDAPARYSIAVWETSTGFPLWRKTLQSWDSKEGYCDIDISPDEKLLLTVDTSYTYADLASTPTLSRILLYEASTGKLYREIRAYDIRSARFVDGGRRIFCDGKLSLVFDVRTGQTLSLTTSEGGSQNPLQVSADGRKALLIENPIYSGSSRQRIEYWELGLPRGIRKIRTISGSNWKTGKPRKFRISPDGKRACIWHQSEGFVEIWDLGTSRRTNVIPMSDVRSVMFTANTRFLILLTKHAYSHCGIALYDRHLSQMLWNHPSKKEGIGGWLNRAEFSRNERYVVTSGDSGICWMDFKTGRVVHKRSGLDMSLSPDRKTMAVATARGLEIHRVP